MDPSRWRISKACRECRVRKIRCNGGNPCQRCEARTLDCVYREKARNRPRKKTSQLADTAAAETRTSSVAASDGDEDGLYVSTAAGLDLSGGSGLGEAEEQAGQAGDGGLQTHSVAATHQASPSCLLQVYYGPSSHFALIHAIYQQMDGTRSVSPSRSDGVEEIGPGLDMFSHRQLFFGDLGDAQAPAPPLSEGTYAIVLDPVAARRYLDRYLSTYWHGVQITSKEGFFRRLENMFRPPAILNLDSGESLVVLIAMSIGALMAGDDAIADFLAIKAKQGILKLQDVVNLQAVQAHYMMGILQHERGMPNAAYIHTGTAVRKAVAAGLHKGAVFPGGQTEEEIHERRTTFWSLYFYETWTSFTLGRPSAVPDPGAAMPVPSDQTFLASLVTVSRIMAKCARIYAPTHDALLPVWHVAEQIREELHQFATLRHRDLGFGVVGDLSPGEVGVRQALLSSIYHHTMLLTFRPFLILRAKMRRESSSAATVVDGKPHAIPAWLDTARDYCLDTAKSTISFLSGACEHNSLVRDTKFHGFFVEGACYVLAFDMMQEGKIIGKRHLPWILGGLQCLRSMLSPPGKSGAEHTPTVIATIKQMVRTVLPNFDTLEASQDRPVPHHRRSQRHEATVAAVVAEMGTSDGMAPDAQNLFTYPSAPFGAEFDGLAAPVLSAAPPPDFAAADVGWNMDFRSLDMETFLSADPINQSFNYP